MKLAATKGAGLDARSRNLAINSSWGRARSCDRDFRYPRTKEPRRAQAGRGFRISAAGSIPSSPKIPGSALAGRPPEPTRSISTVLKRGDEREHAALVAGFKDIGDLKAARPAKSPEVDRNMRMRALLALQQRSGLRAFGRQSLRSKVETGGRKCPSGRPVVRGLKMTLSECPSTPALKGAPPR